MALSIIYRTPSSAFSDGSVVCMSLAPQLSKIRPTKGGSNPLSRQRQRPICRLSLLLVVWLLLMSA
ncbi:hypothetical protein BCR42DRAFT_425591 [Absidia repens]|uniref:Uncharacterized protein n=1 Tax=Absidia repens TaxID=90262 RepID=A0A1X2I297_9FUNG|nr:hypothetical protein BCR42DRAFT_425591 [Absidia repens]